MSEFTGKTIKTIRYLTEAELVSEGWGTHRSVATIELEDGSIIYPSRDEEGNGPGVLFGSDKNGGKFYIQPSR